MSTTNEKKNVHSAGESTVSEHVELKDYTEDNYDGLSIRVILVYLAVNFVAFAQILDLVGSGAYAQNIATVIGGSSQTIWLSQVIAIFTCVLGPIVSQAADYWGRKGLIVSLTACGVAGSIVVARATSMSMAIVGQCICGIAFGAQPLPYAIASEILPRKYRPAAQSGINLVLGLAAITGLLSGSALVQSHPDRFRIYFYITAAILAASAVIIALCYNPQPRPLQNSLTTQQKLSRLDWPGFALLAAGIVLFSIALTWSDNPYPWNDAHTLAPLIIGSLLIVGLGFYSTFIKRDGLLHHDLFKKDRNFAIALLCIFIEGMTFFSGNNFFPQEMAIIFETNQLRVGLRFSVTFYASMLSALICGYFSTATRRLREPVVLAFLCFLTFDILMATTTLNSSSALWAYPLFLGVGLGLCLTCIVTAAQLSTPPHLIAITSGLMVSARSLGGSVALPIYSAIFNAKLSKNMGPAIAQAVLPLGLPPSSLEPLILAMSQHNQQALQNVKGISPEIVQAGLRALQQVFLTSFRYVWVTAGCFALLAAVVSCFLLNPVDDLNDNVDAPLGSRHSKQRDVSNTTAA